MYLSLADITDGHSTGRAPSPISRRLVHITKNGPFAKWTLGLVWLPIGCRYFNESSLFPMFAAFSLLVPVSACPGNCLYDVSHPITCLYCGLKPYTGSPVSTVPGSVVGEAKRRSVVPCLVYEREWYQLLRSRPDGKCRNSEESHNTGITGQHVIIATITALLP